MKLSSRDGKDQSNGLLRRLVRNEDGALIILSLQLFILMLVCTGVAIDLVRVEERRTVIQNTLDRAALAAASLSQDLDPTFVVNDYLEKAGLDYLDIDPVVEEGNFHEWRRVTISAQDKMPTIFKPFTGIEYLTASGNSQALESVGNVEISLVLDISGSMSGTKISKLRTAATDFVGQMFDAVQPASAPAGRLSMSIIPYNQQVVLGSNFSSLWNISTDHTENTCVDVGLLSSGDFEISDTTSLTRTQHGNSSYGSSLENCIETSAATVLAFSNDETALKSKVAGLTAGGNTSIDFGARWGLALLDPASRPVLDAMIDNGWSSSDIAGRPFDYDDGTKQIDEIALKVLVLMTDGENTSAYSTKMKYRTGNAGYTEGGYFVSTKSATAFSTNSSGSTADWKKLYYYVPGKSAPYYSMKDKVWYSSVSGTKYPITWPTVWDYSDNLYFIIDTFLKPPIASLNGWSYDTALSTIYTEMAIQSTNSTKNTALYALCDAAKEKDITVFTIAVETSSSGTAVLKKCASGDAYAYNVTSSDLTTAFASIAASINALRLTN